MKDTFKTVEIAEGVRLCAYDTDRFTTSVLSINIAVPLDPRAASANALVPFLLMRSCEDYPTFIEMRKRLAELYGASIDARVGKLGDTQTLSLSMRILSNKFAFDGEDIFMLCAKQLFDIVFKPNLCGEGFVASELEQEKRFAVERLEAELNDKRIYAHHRLIEEMFKGDVFATNKQGTKEEIEALTPASTYEAYKKIIGGGRIQIDVVGSVDPYEVSNLFESYLSNVEREPYMLFTSILSEAESVKRVEEELPVNQGKLVIGYRTAFADPDTDYARFRVMSIIYGGATFSRLFMNVREKMSLCYYCSARFTRQKGFMVVQSGIENENAEVAIKEINNQLDEMRNGGVTAEDMEKARLTIVDTYKTVCDTPEDIDNWLNSQVLDDEIESPEEYQEMLLKVELQDVINAAKDTTLDTIYLLRGTEKEAE